MKIILNSTSFLLPNNESWNLLKKDNNIIFSDYGSINSRVNIINNVDAEITLFFLPCSSPLPYSVDLTIVSKNKFF